ncbi:hypothetical protein HYT26_00370 [Candidatus Pacearchaeota archaeon]|nr:hypothetical protein [Candidatus Pacearchaeota archaeon]
MDIKEISAKKVYDSRKEPTICVFVKTEAGSFLTSSPSGKSKGKYETPAFAGNVDESIKLLEKLSPKIKGMRIEQFSDLEKIESIIKKNEIGANTLYALEASILKALAYEQRKQLWELLIKDMGKNTGKRMPFPIGSIIEGGLHTRYTAGKRADFQEFLIIPKAGKFSDNVEIMQKAHDLAKDKLKRRNGLGRLSDENAWSTRLNDESCLDVLNETRNNLESEKSVKVDIGIDVAASGFYSPDIYQYKNPEMLLSSKEQLNYIHGLINTFNVFYVEDPFNEEDFKSFKDLREKSGEMPLIVGDDLTASHIDRFAHALKSKSIDAVIIKPNQNGSLLEIKKLIDMAKKYKIITIMSHRSGETTDSTIADLAFGWQTDYIKTGVMGAEREAKLKRLMEIEKSL